MKPTNSKRRKLEQFKRTRDSARLILFDLEATCWEPEEPLRVEILEIGAVNLQVGLPAKDREFGEIVRPLDSPTLSPFCLSLIPIDQSDADSAEPFVPVFARFLAWIGGGPFWLASWGAFDRRQLLAEIGRHGLQMPKQFCGFIDLRREYARQTHARPTSLAAALLFAGLEQEDICHRALPDARNLARLAGILLKGKA